MRNSIRQTKELKRDGDYGVLRQMEKYNLFIGGQVKHRDICLYVCIFKHMTVHKLFVADQRAVQFHTPHLHTIHFRRALRGVEGCFLT